MHFKGKELKILSFITTRGLGELSQGINLKFNNLSSCFPYVDIVLVKVALR